MAAMHATIAARRIPPVLAELPNASYPPAHSRAIAFMIVAAVCWSSGGFLVRQLSLANAWEIVFWRSAFMTLFVAGVLVAIHGARMPRAVLRAGVPGLLAGAFLAGTFFFFIGSLTRTTVANTNILMSVSPFIAALAARVILQEPVPLRTVVAMLAAFAGIVVMFAQTRTPGSSPATCSRSVCPVASPRRSWCCASSMRRWTCCRR